MVHLIPLTTTIKASELAWLFIKDIVRLHGLPDSIVSDRDTKFTSRFWKETHRMMGTKLLMSTAFHPQTDGASERAIRSVTQILRGMTKANQSDWVEKLPMVEFTMNSTVSVTTGFAPFEINGIMPRMIRGDAYLSTKNLNLPKGRAHKLLPKFLGPYKILEGSPESSNYVLELPNELKARGIHSRFHVSRLKPFVANDNRLFPRRDPKVFYDYGMPDDTEWLVDDIVGHQWNKNKLQFHVKWNMGDTTWEPREHCEDLKVLDDYLQLMGVSSPEDLPRYVAKERTNGPPRASGSKAPQATRNNPRKL
ncbi:hypothetical protein NLI96_g12559 [Meripilus lineatus]|uniref:Integrase catalytic domain-containing protein n=1 Tax=Meripilus lineatus TaxID=2056292 RepID=A0AAD5UPV5_9APHY|nr:hypothetical protein NLI96_g12559 [Physisporinus lineatus]